MSSSEPGRAGQARRAEAATALPVPAWGRRRALGLIAAVASGVAATLAVQLLTGLAGNADSSAGPSASTSAGASSSAAAVTPPPSGPGVSRTAEDVEFLFVTRPTNPNIPVPDLGPEYLPNSVRDAGGLTPSIDGFGIFTAVHVDGRYCLILADAFGRGSSTCATAATIAESGLVLTGAVAKAYKGGTVLRSGGLVDVSASILATGESRFDYTPVDKRVPSPGTQ